MQLRHKVNSRWLFTPWRFAVVEVFVCTVSLSVAFISAAFAIEDLSKSFLIIFIPLLVLLFVLLPSFVAGIIYGLFALVIEFLTNKPLNLLLGSIFGCISGLIVLYFIKLLINFNNHSKHSPYAKQNLLIISGIVALTCTMTGFILSYRELVLRRKLELS